MTKAEKKAQRKLAIEEFKQRREIEFRNSKKSQSNNSYAQRIARIKQYYDDAFVPNFSSEEIKLPEESKLKFPKTTYTHFDHSTEAISPQDIQSLIATLNGSPVPSDNSEISFSTDASLTFSSQLTTEDKWKF